ncbi:flavodoxin family protein [Phenylobacterium aquaticum]|uniref:flavodoxin family protein n=1 Tax=Phenylobacterium aquaticum TaxID=1763816 RepID=UPI0026F28D5C|nr:flavodoxin family protein [Phenylobacterium aquaticum]
MSKVAIVYHSAAGHTAALAQSAAEGVRDAGADPILLSLDGGDFAPVLEAVAAADAVIFGAPTFMGDLSAGFRAFAEASAGAWYGQAWKDKLAAGFTVSGSYSGDKLNSLTSLAVFAAQHGMVWVSTGLLPGHAYGKVGPEDVNRLGSFLGVMAQADNAPADVTPPSGDHRTVRLLGARVAEAARRWKAGAPEAVAQAA